MARRTKIYYSTTLLGVGAILAALAGRHLVGLSEAPVTSIRTTEDTPVAKPASPYLTHQPTILKADAALAPPVDEQPKPEPIPSEFRDYVTDDETSTLREASSADFLPIPSLDSPERR